MTVEPSFFGVPVGARCWSKTSSRPGTWKRWIQCTELHTRKHCSVCLLRAENCPHTIAKRVILIFYWSQSLFLKHAATIHYNLSTVHKRQKTQIDTIILHKIDQTNIGRPLTNCQSVFLSSNNYNRYIVKIWVMILKYHNMYQDRVLDKWKYIITI